MALFAGGLGLVAATLAARLWTLSIPTIDPDEFAFAMVARDVLAGKLPNTGVFDNKPVGLTYVFALAEWIGERSLAAVHAVGLLAALATAALLHATARRLRLSQAAAMGLAALSSCGLLCLGGWASMSELVAAPLLCLANLLLLRQDRPGWRAALGVGCAFGLACQITYLAAPACLLSTAGVLAVGGGGLRERLKTATLIGAALAAVTVLIWLPQMVAGAWPAYIHEQLLYHGRYRAPAPHLRKWLTGFVLPLAGLYAPAVLAAWSAARRRLPPRAWPLVLGGIGAAAAAAASNHFFRHYLILSVPYARAPA
jgi:hypothetical protein